MDFTLTLTDDCLLLIFDRVPLYQRLTTVPLVCRRWERLQPMVRRAATSLTLSFGSLRYKSCYSISSPFHLVDHQASITDDPDLLRPVSQTSFMPQPDLGAMKRLFTELPNISRLTIIQLKESDEEVFPPFRLWPVMEHYARQLTSFDFHYLYYGLPPAYGQPRDIREYEFNRAVHSANFHRLLSLINYGMPQLRHLLLDSEPAIIEPENQRNMFANPSFPLGSLYLPVLKRLRSFSFRSGDHEDVLFGSLKKFAGNEQSALKLRLGVPLLRKATFGFQFAEYPTMEGQLWKADGLRLLQLYRLDYLFVKRISLNALITLLPALASNLRYLHLELTDGGENLVPLFTALSSLPQLTRLHLNLHQMLWHNPVPADLPPLPSVTSLSLYWPFDNSVHFEPVLQLARVFPALQKLTIDGQMFEGCSIDSLECHCTRVQLAFGFLLWGEIPPLCIRPALKASLMKYPPEAVPLINLNTKGGRKWFTVEEL